MMMIIIIIKWKSDRAGKDETLEIGSIMKE